MGFITVAQSLFATLANLIVISSTIATVNTTSAHNYSVGDTVSGILDAGSDGYYQVKGADITAVLSSTSFQLTFINSNFPIGNFNYNWVNLLPGTYTLNNNSYITRDEFYRDNYVAVDLLELHLKNSAGTSDPLYLCGGGYNISFDSPTAPTAGTNVYEAQGDFIGVSSLSEDFEVKVGKFSISLSGVGNSYVNRFTAYSPEGQRVVIYRAFLEYKVVNGIDGLVIVPNPITLFDGIVYNVGISETGSSCQVTVECATLFSDFDRSNGRKTNNGSNWLFQDGNTYDRSMEQAGFVGQSNFLWGRL